MTELSRIQKDAIIKAIGLDGLDQESKDILLGLLKDENKTENYKEVLFEGYGPHGAAILIETATNNNNRTVANIRSYFNKSNGNLGKAGSVEFMFDHICNFRLKSEKIIPEEIELEFIDYGVEEVEVENNEILIYAPFNDFGSIQKGPDVRRMRQNIMTKHVWQKITRTKSSQKNQICYKYNWLKAILQ